MPARTVAVLLLAVAVAVRVSPDTAVPATCARAFTVALATWGAVELSRLCARDATGVGPWLAGLLYGCGPVLMATALAQPRDALVASVLPWIALPLLKDRSGWSFAIWGSWLAVAAVGSPAWTIAALVVAVVTAFPRNRRDLPGALVWLGFAALAVAWSISGPAGTWTTSHGVAATTRYTGTLSLPGSAEQQWLWLTLILAGPVVVLAAAAVFSRGAGHPAVAFWCLGAAGLAVGGAAATTTGESYVDAALVLVSLASCLAWPPLMDHLGSVFSAGSDASGAVRVAAGIAAVAIAVSSAAGLLAGAHERGRPDTPLDQAIAGFSTQT
jgi:hypothetical protein